MDARGILSKKAKNMEWKTPLCPKKCEYGMLKKNATTSPSAIIEEIIAARQKLRGIDPSENALPAATATTVWVIIVGNENPSNVLFHDFIGIMSSISF
jgi:hypothetical protein